MPHIRAQALIGLSLESYINISILYHMFINTILMHQETTIVKIEFLIITWFLFSTISVGYQIGLIWLSYPILSLKAFIFSWQSNYKLHSLSILQ
jgi:hypothetical protein